MSSDLKIIIAEQQKIILELHQQLKDAQEENQVLRKQSEQALDWLDEWIVATKKLQDNIASKTKS